MNIEEIYKIADKDINIINEYIKSKNGEVVEYMVLSDRALTGRSSKGDLNIMFVKNNIKIYNEYKYNSYDISDFQKFLRNYKIKQILDV